MQKTTKFGKKNEPHMIIFAQGQNIRHFTIRPWVATLAGTVLMAMAVGYLLSTSYLILRDDILNSTISRQAMLQHAYEDRIASLRGQVDRITSHRLLDQQFMENKITELASRQELIAKRSDMLEPLLDRAKTLGVDPSDAAELPIPQLRPTNGSIKSASLIGSDIDPIVTSSIRETETDALPAITVLAVVKNELTGIEKAQLKQVAALADATIEKNNRIVDAARRAGLPLKTQDIEAMGGPYIPAMGENSSETFNREVKEFNLAVTMLEKTRSEVQSFPIANPAPGKSISSNFGNRRDPILGSSAFHSGIDFRAETGTPIRSTAAGKVVKAGRYGGYGKMIEIRHANGLSTRYGHLSKIYVQPGQNVKAGVKIGASGNTGRSTGPHLHYEVRTNNKAINPLNYINAGARLNDLL